MQYEIINNQDNIKDSIIKKTGHVITFTMRDVEQNIVELKKIMKEVTAKKEYEQAKADNVAHFHPEIAEMPGEKLMAAYIYQDAVGTVKACNDKLAEVEKTLNDLQAEVEDIKRQVPEVAIVYSEKAPEEPVEPAKDEQA